MLGKHKTIKNYAVKVLLALSSIVIFLIFAEIISRFTERISFYDNDVNLQQGDVHMHRISSIPGLSYELVPFSKDVNQDIYINSKGIRDREYAIPKPPGVSRIIIIGDSITFGMGCKTVDTYPRVLERKINENLPSGTKYEILNAGVYAYNLMQKVIFLESRLLDYNPDLVVLEFYNDDYQRTRILKLSNVPNIPEGQDTAVKMEKKEIFSTNMAQLVPLPYNFNKRLLYASAFYRFLNMRFYNLLSKIDPIKYYPNAYKFVGGKNALEYNRGAFAILNNLAREYKFKVVIVAFPQLVNISSNSNNDSYVRTEVKALYKVDVLDLFPQFKKRADLLQLRNWPQDDCHLNPLGNKLAAEEIYDFLLNHGYLKK